LPITDLQGLPYPDSDDPPNGPEQITALAMGVERKLVMVFTSAAQRATKIAAPTEGMMCWLSDVNRMEIYTGAGWFAVQVGDGPLGYKADGWINSDFALTGSYALMVACDTFSNPSTTRKYRVDYFALHTTDTSTGGVVDVILTVTAGGSPSAGGAGTGSAQIPIVSTGTGGGTRITLTGHGTSWPAGNVTVAAYAKEAVGACNVSGFRSIFVEDIGV
jgi:hypothetical protein